MADDGRHAMTEAEFQQHVDQAFRVGMSQIPQEILELVRLLYDQQPRNFLEIGTDRGGTFYLFCQLAHPQGKKISVDLPGGPWASLARERAMERNRSMQSWSRNVSILDGNSHDPSMLLAVERILNGERCDFLFIDGDHSYKGVKRDYFLYRHLVKPGGYIIFHDIVDSPRHRREECFVGQLWSELHGEKQEFSAGQDWAGIGVLSVSPHRAFRRPIHLLFQSVLARFHSANA